MEEQKVVRIICGYQVGGDDLVVEYKLRPIPLEVLQQMFLVPDDNPMFDSYKLKKKHFEWLQKYFIDPIAWGEYDLYLECYKK